MCLKSISNFYLQIIKFYVLCNYQSNKSSFRIKKIMRKNFINQLSKAHKKASSNFSQTNSTRFTSPQPSPLETPKINVCHDSNGEISLNKQNTKDSDIFKVLFNSHTRNFSAELPEQKEEEPFFQMQNLANLSHKKSFNEKDSVKRSSARSIQTVRSEFRRQTANKMLPVTRNCKRRQGTMPKKTQLDFFNFISNSHEKLAQKGKAQLLTQCLSWYIRRTTQEQISKDIQEIQRLKESLQKYTAFNGYDYSSFLCNSVMKKINNNAQLWDSSLMRYFTKNLPKLLYFISYQAYCLKQCKGVGYQILIIINKDIEYYSRRLGFYRISLKACFDIAQLFCNAKKFDMAEQYYTRTLKLAVAQNDIYCQQKAIDKMGLCSYYQGKINEADYYHQNVHNLSQMSTNLIRDNYSHQDQIIRLFKQKFHVNCEVQSTKNNIQKETFNFGQSTNRKNLAKQNIIKIEKDLNQMTRIANLRGQIPKILKAQQKVRKVGLKRYHGKLYIQPKRTKFRSKQPENDEIILSHRSTNRFNNDWERKRIDKQCRVLVDLLNNMTNGGLKDRFKTTPSQQQF